MGPIVRKLKTEYQSLESHNLWSPKDMNAKADANKIAGLHAKFNKLTEKVGSQSPAGFVRKCWTFGGDHVQAD